MASKKKFRRNIDVSLQTKASIRSHTSKSELDDTFTKWLYSGQINWDFLNLLAYLQYDPAAELLGLPANQITPQFKFEKVDLVYKGLPDIITLMATREVYKYLWNWLQATLDEEKLIDVFDHLGELTSIEQAQLLKSWGLSPDRQAQIVDYVDILDALKYWHRAAVGLMVHFKLLEPVKNFNFDKMYCSGDLHASFLEELEFVAESLYKLAIVKEKTGQGTTQNAYLFRKLSAVLNYLCQWMTFICAGQAPVPGLREDLFFTCLELAGNFSLALPVAEQLRIYIFQLLRENMVSTGSPNE